MTDHAIDYPDSGVSHKPIGARNVFRIFACLLILANSSCDNHQNMRLKEIKFSGFDEYVRLSDIRNCTVLNIQEDKNPTYSGLFIPTGDHTPQAFLIAGKKYIAIPSNGLWKEWMENRDGTGGPQYASAINRPDRVEISGVKISGSFSCSEQHSNLSGAEGVIFIKSYGKPKG